MTRLRALLVDDEPLALTRLAHTLATIDGVEVVGSTTRASDVPTLVAEMKPDLLLLDIAMPGLNGLDLAARLPEATRPAVIFVTAFDRHAARAFDIDAADYVMKPVAPARLAQAIERAALWLKARTRPADDGDVAVTAPPGASSIIDSLWAYRHREMVRVRIDDIEWIEADGDYVRLHTGEGHPALVRMTLTALERQLDATHFIRVHRSVICRRSAIAALRRKASGAIAAALLSGGEAPVGRKFSGGLRTMMRRVTG